MTIHLPEPVERSLNAAVQSGRFPSVDDALAAAWLAFNGPAQPSQADLLTTPASGEKATVDGQKPIWEIIEEENRSIPSEVWDDLPTDLSAQHDHYIYGTPKRTDT